MKIINLKREGVKMRMRDVIAFGINKVSTIRKDEIIEEFKKMGCAIKSE